jgi:hypothetical protein
MKIPVSKRAVLQRISRALRLRNLELRTARADKRKMLGEYYVVGLKGLVEKDVDLDELAAELEVLEPWEQFKK